MMIEWMADVGAGCGGEKMATTGSVCLCSPVAQSRRRAVALPSGVRQTEAVEGQGEGSEEAAYTTNPWPAERGT